MLARILESAWQQKCLQNTVTTGCQTFALHHDDDWSISKVFANPAAMSCPSQFTRLDIGCGGNEVPVHGILPLLKRFMIQRNCWNSVNLQHVPSKMLDTT